MKRLWTPAWVLLSGGICLLTLGALYQLVDIKQHRRWAFPFIVIGMNSLAFYLMRHLMEDFLAENLQRHLHLTHPALIGTCSLSILCGIALWLYRRKIFLRI